MTLYATRQWKRLRRLKLQVTPLCEACEAIGRLTVATVVDHVVAVTAGGEPFPPLDGLMSLCVSCHNSKTSRVEVHGQQPLIKGCGTDGLPVDKSHPFYGTKRR
jgi:5-methylcytosine-specific restriction protein A